MWVLGEAIAYLMCASSSWDLDEMLLEECFQGKTKRKLCKTVSVAVGVWVLGGNFQDAQSYVTVSEWKTRQGQMGNAQEKSSRVVGVSSRRVLPQAVLSTSRQGGSHQLTLSITDRRSSCGWLCFIHTENHTQVPGLLPWGSFLFVVRFELGLSGFMVIAVRMLYWAAIRRWYSCVDMHSGKMEEVSQPNTVPCLVFKWVLSIWTQILCSFHSLS